MREFSKYVEHLLFTCSALPRGAKPTALLCLYLSNQIYAHASCLSKMRVFVF